jgi:hypothetical protein
VRQEEIPEVRLIKPREFSRLIRRAHLHPTTKLVALHVMTYANFDDGKEIFPGEELIAEELGRTQRCIREHLKILRDLQILVRVRHNSGQRGVYDEYWLSWPLDIEKVSFRPPRGDNPLPSVRLFRRRPEAAADEESEPEAAA